MSDLIKALRFQGRFGSETEDDARARRYRERCEAADRIEALEAEIVQLRAATQPAPIPAQTGTGEANRALLDEHDSQRPKAGHCHQCGLPLIANPHPDAGKPGSYLEVGCPVECLPCMVSSRHQWSKRATAAESKLRELTARPAEASAGNALTGEAKDATRYRWLRQMPSYGAEKSVCGSLGKGVDMLQGESLDKAIDAHINAGQAGKEGGA